MISTYQLIRKVSSIFVDFNLSTMFYFHQRSHDMTTTPQKSYINTTVTTELLKSLKILAAQEGKRLNNLLEEAIQDLLKKYKEKVEN